MLKNRHRVPASVLAVAILISATTVSGTGQVFAQPYKLVVHNIENLFDADGYAVFQDYRPVDPEGNPQYTPAHVLTKIQKHARLMARYNDGAGPDVIVFSEIESDFTPLPDGERYDHRVVLERYADVTLDQMLGEMFNEEVADLPSEILLLKGFEDHGLTGYDLAVAYERDENLRPTHVQKNVIFSRLPIQHEKTRSHPTEGARPILEVWLDVDGYDLAVFANHWRSRASDREMERIRIQNAQVLKDRLDELRAENPAVDFILGGDFNSDYNQSHRYPYMEKTAVNDVLRSVGDERKVKQGGTDVVYNLWYEHDISERGSDTFRGYWGTLMQIMVSPGMYDFHGVQYVDNSFDVGRFPGKNVYVNSGMPNRWHFFGEGGGYSDHLPISMKFTVVEYDDPEKKMTLVDPGVNDDEQWEPIPVVYEIPDREHLLMPEEYAGMELRSAEFFDRLFYVTGTITENRQVKVNGEYYDLFSHDRELRDRLSEMGGTGEQVRFIGRLGMFRGSWQFVIGDSKYLNPEW
jgi:endonuclease/exonuclease/phosphatase family metal-dependent hydrolase